MKTLYTPEQFASTNAANIENLLKLAKVAFDGAERLAQLNLRTVQTALKEGAAGGQTLMSTKDVQELMQVQTELAHPIVENAVAYARSVYDIATDGQKQFAEIVEGQVAALNKTVAAALDQAAQSALPGSEPAFNAVKSAMAAASNAYETFNASAKQFANVATTNAAAAVEASLGAVRSAAKAKKTAKKA
jgi:phasin family protein